MFSWQQVVDGVGVELIGQVVVLAGAADTTPAVSFGKSESGVP